MDTTAPTHGHDGALQRRRHDAGRHQRCPACAAVAAELEAGSAYAAASAPAAGATLPGLLAAGALAGLPAFAVSAPPSRVRSSGRARDAATPVLLERDRRDPHRHGRVTLIDAPSAAIEGVVLAVGADEAEAGGDPYLPEVAA